MNPRAVTHLLAHILMVLGLAMAACLLAGLYYDDPQPARLALGITGLTLLLVGLLAARLTRTEELELTRRDGFIIVTFGWILASLAGALPFWLTGVIPSPVAALFETMSGFTTTGASVLSRLNAVPRGILLWRALTHFFGGMGILVLCVAVLPFLGVGGMQVFRAEMPGPSKDRLTPRIITTAKYLWFIYVGLVIVEALLLKYAGMPWFDSWCHSFASIATGGFSTQDASIGFYHNVRIEMIVTVFMFLAGVNFALHYRAVTGQPLSYFRDPEFLFYLGVWVTFGLVVTLNIWHTLFPTFPAAFRAAFFTVTSIMTTTGFATADFGQWPALSQVLLVLLMFVGACAGSTAGAIKLIRFMVLIKAMIRELRVFLYPQAVMQVKVGGTPVEPQVVSNIAAFFVIYMLIFAGATAIMCFYAPDITTALTAVAATLGNIGPGLGAVGPVQTYAEIPDAGLFLLTLCMLLGRLELYTVLVLLLPSFWKK